MGITRKVRESYFSVGLVEITLSTLTTLTRLYIPTVISCHGLKDVRVKP